MNKKGGEIFEVPLINLKKKKEKTPRFPPPIPPWKHERRIFTAKLATLPGGNNDRSERWRSLGNNESLIPSFKMEGGMRTLESGYRRHGAAKTYPWPNPIQRSRSDSPLPTFRKVFDFRDCRPR